MPEFDNSDLYFDVIMPLFDLDNDPKFTTKIYISDILLGNVERYNATTCCRHLKSCFTCGKGKALKVTDFKLPSQKLW